MRSIPACAGEPSARARAISASWVYPRLCGGTSTAPDVPATAPGLSPPVRGNRQHQRVRRVSGGSIPACAGEPETGGPLAFLPEVYPRLCGGTVRSAGRQFRVQGLSPPVRGNLHRRTVRRSLAGSIPACAGEPRTSRTCSTVSRVYPRLCGGTTSRYHFRR